MGAGTGGVIGVEVFYPGPNGPYYADLNCTGPDATTANTDTVRLAYTGTSTNQRTHVSMLAPGFTDEGGPDESEIEVLLSGVPSVTVGARRSVVAGTSGGETRINLNPAETVKDADIVVEGPGTPGVTLSGTSLDDVMDARGGAGTGEPLASPLTVETDSGADLLYGGAGPAYLDGGADHDTLTAGSGPATLMGGDGSRAVLSGNDTLTGGPADDVFLPRYGNDVVDGSGGGVDTLRLDSPGAVDMARTTSQYTRQGWKTFRGGIEVIETGDDSVTLRGSSAPETFRTGKGDDVIAGRGGADRIEAGLGRDIADFAGATRGVTVDATSTAPQADGRGAFDTLIGVEGLVGTAYADSLRGNDLWGGAGDDKLAGRTFAPIRYYPTFYTVLRGEAGADTLTGSELVDVLEGGTGPDKLAGGEGDDHLRPGSDGSGGPDGADTIDGQGGNDTLLYSERTGGVAVLLDGLRNEGADPDGDGVSTAGEEGDLATSVEWATGGSGPDRFRAPYTGLNVFRGEGGDDWIDGGPSRDMLVGGTGVDTVSYASRKGPVAISLDGVRNDGYSDEQDLIDMDVENAVGSQGDDRMSALRPVANALTGGPGADRIDVRDGGSVADHVACGEGADSYRIDAGDLAEECETALP